METEENYCIRILLRAIDSIIKDSCITKSDPMIPRAVVEKNVLIHARSMTDLVRNMKKEFKEDSKEEECTQR